MKTKGSPKRHSPKKAAKIIAKAIWDQLELLPKKQRRKRLREGIREMKAKIASTKAASLCSAGDIDPKPQRPDCNDPIRLAARSGR